MTHPTEDRSRASATDGEHRTSPAGSERQTPEYTVDGTVARVHRLREGLRDAGVSSQSADLLTRVGTEVAQTGSKIGSWVGQKVESERADVWVRSRAVVIGVVEAGFKALRNPGHRFTTKLWATDMSAGRPISKVMGEVKDGIPPLDFGSFLDEVQDRYWQRFGRQMSPREWPGLAAVHTMDIELTFGEYEQEVSARLTALFQESASDTSDMVVEIRQAYLARINNVLDQIEEAMRANTGGRRLGRVSMGGSKSARLSSKAKPQIENLVSQLYATSAQGIQGVLSPTEISGMLTAARLVPTLDEVAAQTDGLYDWAVSNLRIRQTNSVDRETSRLVAANSVSAPAQQQAYQQGQRQGAAHAEGKDRDGLTPEDARVRDMAVQEVARVLQQLGRDMTTTQIVRYLAKEYHPDRLTAQGIKEDDPRFTRCAELFKAVSGWRDALGDDVLIEMGKPIPRVKKDSL